MRKAGNFKMAWQSIRSAKWRSFLTMLGVIIGVLAVVTTVSLGEGVKQQIRRQSDSRGQDLITITSGKRVERDDKGEITEVKNTFTSGSTLGDLDFKNVLAIEDMENVAPLARVTGEASHEDKTYEPIIIATTSDLPRVLNQSLAYGGFFTDSRSDNDSAVIGSRVAENLFGENVPMGKSFELRDKTFVVRGIFEEFPPVADPIQNQDFNNAVFIPYDSGRELVAGSILLDQILAKPKENIEAKDASKNIRERLLQLHAGQEDFTVLTQDELLVVAGNFLNLITTFISAVAAISLLVGGIGIMNIMFVLVTERTREIGVRKAVGATTQQILSQFISEALLISLIGGLLGVLLSILTNFLLRVFTDLQPIITWPVIGVAIVTSGIVGVVFGATPAFKAARQDPIESLRYE